MDDHTLVLIGAFGGAALGVCGGLVGTYCSVRNTKGPRERAFVVRAAAVGWLAVSAFVAALWFAPSPYQVLLWLPYMAGLPFAARAWNRRQARIRQEESGPDA